MIDPKDLVNNLQKKPYESRVKLLWTIVALSAVVLIIIWIFSIKSNISGLNSKNLIDTSGSVKSSSVVTDEKWVQVERVESSGNNFKIYFNINNTTDDILNFPNNDEITLNLDSQSTNPTQITTRQGSPFVEKILSHTQNFGVMIFPQFKAATGMLVIDGMSLEKNPDQSFKQKIELDFKELNKSTEVRN